MPMVGKSPAIPEQPRRRPGRPTKEEAQRRDLAQRGVDPASIDPQRILAAIASDAGAAPTARVRAALALLRGRKPDKPPGKKAIAEAEAATAAGSIDEWLGDPWPNGRRPGSA